jgi:pyruvate,water dikinase
MGEALYNLAASEEIHRYNDADTFLYALKSGELCEEFISSWQGFLEEFGARCPKEIDVATPRPKENPAAVFEQAKKLALSIKSGSESFFAINRKKRESAYQALLAEAHRMGKSTARQFEKNYRILYNFGGFRESGKQYITKAVDLFRQEALALGKRFVSEGRLENAEQVFDLSIDDIDRASANPTMELRELVQKRTAFTDRLRKSHFAVRIIDSRGKIFMPPVNLTENGGFSGIAISPGVVRGRAKVLHTANEKTLLPGEILVARATDPGWTPLFINAGGIALEIGGALQHGAVVAREYGIPCVSGITDATRFISDGQLIELDGSNGVVRILDGDKPVYPPVSEAEKNARKEKAARKKKEKIIRRIKQTVLMMIPVFLSPFLVLFVGALLFILVKLLMGVGAVQSIADFRMIIETNFTLISLSTWLVVLIAIAFAFWHNRKKINKAIKDFFSNKQH